LIAGNPAQFVQSNVKWGNFKELGNKRKQL